MSDRSSAEQVGLDWLQRQNVLRAACDHPRMAPVSPPTVVQCPATGCGLEGAEDGPGRYPACAILAAAQLESNRGIHMELRDLKPEEVTEYKRRLLAAIPPTGSIGNISLLRELGGDDDIYWAVRDELIRDGALEAGRGRGGSVRRITVKAAAPPADREADLYGPILATLKKDWAQDYRYGDFDAEITARQGRRETGGRWSRPDITLITFDAFRYVPGKHLDVITFEVKRHEGIDVTAVYESLAHRRAAHYSYLLIHVPAREAEASAATIEELSHEAEEHGVGLVAFGAPDDYRTWEFHEEADRNDPDPADINEFIDDQLTDGFKDRITRWLR